MNYTPRDCVIVSLSPRPEGYECEPFNNPADFFLDVINGDSTAVAAGKGIQKSKGTDVKSHTGKNMGYLFINLFIYLSYIPPFPWEGSGS